MSIFQPPREQPPRATLPDTTREAGPSPHRSHHSAARARPQPWNWLKIATMLLGLLLIGLIYYRTTYVSGLELNSHTWEQREFSLRRDPLTGMQLGGVRHNAPARIGLWTTVDNPRSKKMGAAILKYFDTRPPEPLRWDLVRLDDSRSPGARASILVDLLAALDHEQQPLWARWTARFPERAAVLWPAAQQLVAADQYTWLPQLFEQATLENSTEDFSRSAGQLVTTALGANSKTGPVLQPAPDEPELPAQDRQP